jgi:NB-ARC domain
LSLLNENLSPGHVKTGADIVVLYGTGGIGKTQIALEYAYQSEDTFNAIFWIDGTSLETVQRSFLDAINRILLHYEELGLPVCRRMEALTTTMTGDINTKSGNMGTGDPSAVKEAFHDWLSKDKSNSWLLIFDNVDDLESFNIREFFPSSSGCSTLVTSRRSELSAIYTSIEVTEMGEGDALNLLERSSNLKLKIGSKGAIPEPEYQR